jgi:spermidine synthase
MCIMLCTNNATYSFGTNYHPFILTWNWFKTNQIPYPNQLLLLGGAFGSAIQLLIQQYGHQPQQTTIVDIDNEIIKKAEHYFAFSGHKQINWVCKDAFEYVYECRQQYDCIAIDLFLEMAIPEQFTQKTFLQQCKTLLKPNGILMMNTYFAIPKDAVDFENKLQQVFTTYTKLKRDVNNIYISQLK